MIWAAITAANGRFYRAESWADPLDGPGMLRVGDSADGRQWTVRPGLVWPSAGRALRIAVNGDLLLAVAKGQNGGACLIGNDRGITRALGSTHGESSVGVEALPTQLGFFRVGAVISAAEWRSWIVDGRTLDATVESTHPVPNGWADGWVDFRNGQPLWLPEYRGRTVLGYQLGIYVSCGDYYIGQSYIAPGIDAVNLATGALARVCSGYSPVQPHAAIVGARIVVAFSADAPQFVCSDDFGSAPVGAAPAPVPVPAPPVASPSAPTPALPATGPPAIRVPEFAPIQHAMALSFTDKPATKQLCGVGDAASPDHVGVLLTVDKDDHAPAIALARERALPLYAYWDDPGYPLTLSTRA